MFRLGRRRAKLTPWSSTDEYFYDLGHQMLSDRGADVVGASATSFPEDDYVWLGGRPVAFVRGKFSPNWIRSADVAGSDCSRDSESGLCGTFMLVTDYLGKPVVTFDRGGTSGTATYEGFGYANRREWRFGSPHFLQTLQTITTITPNIPPGFDGPLRLLMSRSNYSASSSVALDGTNQTVLQGNRGHAWSNWQYSSNNTWPVVWSGVTADYGFDIEAYEVHPKQAWVWWAWTPLRYPGQYYDAETELHENWNRFYDPSTGRYLSPEPALVGSIPVPAAGMGQRIINWAGTASVDELSRVAAELWPNGAPTAARLRAPMTLPVYSYAANNPLYYGDPDGNNPVVIGGGVVIGTGVIAGGAVILAGGIALSACLQIETCRREIRCVIEYLADIGRCAGTTVVTLCRGGAPSERDALCYERAANNYAQCKSGRPRFTGFPPGWPAPSGP